jgi:hypothetical protein
MDPRRKVKGRRASVCYISPWSVLKAWPSFCLRVPEDNQIAFVKMAQIVFC